MHRWVQSIFEAQKKCLSTDGMHPFVCPRFSPSERRCGDFVDFSMQMTTKKKKLSAKLAWLLTMLFAPLPKR